MSSRTDGEYRVVRNDGTLYMECDLETAERLVRQLNERYEGVYTYHIERGDTMRELGIEVNG